MTGNDRYDKARALFLALVMVISVFGMTVAFAGGAAAAVTDVTGNSADNVEIGNADTAVTQQVSFDVTIDGNSASETVTLNVSNATSDVSIAGDTSDVSITSGTGVSISSVTDNTGTSPETIDITLSDDSSDGSHTVTVQATLTHDTSVVNSESTGVLFDITDNDDNTDTVSFDYVDTVNPTAAYGSVDDAIVQSGTTVTVTYDLQDVGTGIDSGAVQIRNSTDAVVVEKTVSNGLSTGTGQTVDLTIPDGTAEGTNYDVFVTGTDGAGNTATGHSGDNEIQIDDSNPTVSFNQISGSSEVSTGESVTVDYSLQDDESSIASGAVQIQDSQGSVVVEETVAGALTTGTGQTIDLTIPGDTAEGDYDVFVTGTDDADNTNTDTGSNAVTVNNTVNSISVTDPGYTINTTSTIEVTGSLDSQSNVTFQLSDSGDSATITKGNLGTSFTTSIDLSGLNPTGDNSYLDDGSITVQADAGDAFGTSEVKTTFNLDDQVTQVSTPDDPFQNSSTAFTVEGSAQSNDKAVTINITDADSDSHTFNDAVTPTSGTFSVDLDLSAATFNGGNDDGLSDGEVTISAAQGSVGSADTNPEAQTTATADSTQPEGGIAEPTSDVFKRPGDTLKVGYYYVDDNPQNIKVQLIDGDADDPDGEVTDVSDSQYTDDGNVRTITLESITNVDDGQYDVKVIAKDSAGNTNTFETSGTPVFVDSSGDSPTVTVNSLTPADKAAPGDTVTVDYDYAEDTPTTNADITFELLNETDAVVSTETETNVAPDTGLTHDFTLPSGLEGDYRIKVTADKLEYGDSDSSTSAAVTVNANKPAIDSVEGAANSDTVTVTFDEPVYANNDGTGALDATDFAYEDVNAGSAGSIDSVSHSAGSATATLTLNASVSPGDLNSDLIGARTGDVYDYAGATAGTAGVALQDTSTDFSLSAQDDITASDVDIDNHQDYTVDVGFSTSEKVTVDLNITGSGASEVNRTKSTTDGSVTFNNLDVSAFDDGDLTVSVTVDDYSQTEDHSVTDSVTVTKDTKPVMYGLSGAESGADTLTVQFDMGVENATGAALSADNFSYVNGGDGAAQNISSVSHNADDSAVTLTLNQSLTVADLGNDKISIAANEVYNRDGTTAAVSQSLTVTDTEAASPVNLVTPETDAEVLKSNSDTLQLTYNYEEDSPQDVEVWIGNQMVTLDDSQYSTNGVDKTVTIDLSQFTLADEKLYDVTVKVVDANGNENSATNVNALMVDDEVPVVNVLNLNVDSTTSPSDATTSDTVTVEFDYSDKTDGTANLVVVDQQDNDLLSGGVLASKSVSDGLNTFEVDLSNYDNIDNRDLAFKVSAVDDNGNSDSAMNLNAELASQDVATLTVNDAAPKIVNVEGHVDSKWVDVTFSEPVWAADGDISADDFAYEDVSGDSASAVEAVDTATGDQTTVALRLDATVQASDVDTDQISAREGAIIDGVNVAAGTAGVTISEQPPALMGIDTHSAEDEPVVRVEFTEGVAASDGSALTAENFTYSDENDGVGATGISTVSHQAGDDYAWVELNATINETDIGNDTLGIGADEVYDSAGLAASGEAMTLGDKAGPAIFEFDASADGHDLTVNVTSNEPLGEMQVHVDDLLPALAQDVKAQSTSASPSYTLTEEDFTQVNASSYEYQYSATLTVDRDGEYNVWGQTLADEAGNDQIAGWNQDHQTVDATDPSVENAAIISAQASHTEIGVLFDEAVDVHTDDISVEGATVVDSYEAHGGDGHMVVVVDGELPTGDEPVLSVEGGQEIAGDTTVSDSTTVHTLQIKLTDWNDGVNFVSVPAATGSLDISELDTSNVESIMTYDRSVEGNWATWTPESDNADDFDELKGGVGYIIKVDDDTTWDVNVYNTPDGGPATPQQTQLDEGWNLVGHWQEGDQPTPVALNTLQTDGNPTWTTVYGQDTSGAYEYYEASDNELDSGYAYWVFVTNDEVYGETPFQQAK